MRHWNGGDKKANVSILVLLYVLPRRREKVEGKNETETEQHRDGCEERADEKHHDGGPDEPHQRGLPGEVLEGRAEVGGRGQVEAETGEVDAGVGEEEEDGAELGALVEEAEEEDDLE